MTTLRRINQDDLRNHNLSVVISTPLLIVGGRYCGIGLQVNTDGYGTIVLDLDGTVVAERWVDADMSDVDADDIFSELNALSLEQERRLADRG